MAFVISTPNFKLISPSLICHSPHNNPQATTPCFKYKLPILKNSTSKRLTSNSLTPIRKNMDSSNTPNNKRSTRAKSAAIPVQELDLNSYKIWWSDIIVRDPKNVFVRREWNSLDVGNLSVIITLHGLALCSPFAFNWGAIWMAGVLAMVTGYIGICLSYHRNLTHRSFKLPKWLEYFFAYCGVLALQGDPIGWVSTHRYHHQFCDSEQDPHSPIKGFWFSHMNWLFDTEVDSWRTKLQALSLKNSKSQEGISIQDMPLSMDLPFVASSVGPPKRGDINNVADLEKQPFYRFIRSTCLLHQLLLGLLLYVFGGFPYLVWGMGVRFTLVLHITFLVNSVCHVWGNQAWNTGDLSKNNWWVALLTCGEGWHNNHHAFPYSARHGLKWWQVDMIWYTVKLLEVLGLAKDIKLPLEAHKECLAFNSEGTGA